MKRSVGGAERLRVAIDAQVLPDGRAGGVASVLVALIRALGELHDGGEEYVIVGPWEDPYWLAPYVGPNQRIVPGPEQRRGWVPTPLSPLVRGCREILRRSAGIGNVWPEVPVSNGFYEGLGCEVVHFPYQRFVVCARQTIYNPHDLQHRHYPQFFDPATIASREATYRAGCQFSHTVVVASEWVRRDVLRQYRLSPRKVRMIPWAAPTQVYPEPTAEAVADVQRKRGLERPFAFYPAVTWEHKNHVRLLEALELLRRRDGQTVRLVCTGHQGGFWPQIQKRMLELGLGRQVTFLGVVPGAELRAIYRLAQFVVIPTLFEAASGPLFEAWHEGAAVACSNVTSLPEQAGDAALLFDPFSVERIAAALATMAMNRELREELRQRGLRRLKDFGWERTARAYRAVFRGAAGRALTDQDESLLR